MKDDTTFANDAKEVIKKYFSRGKHHVACVMEGDSAAYYGLHVDTAGIDICAEPVALANATLGNEKRLKRAVSVYWNGSSEPEVIAPCGNCRQLLLEHCPELRVVFEEDGKIVSLPISDLLPHPYLHP